MAITGFEITDKAWFNFSLFKPISSEYTKFDEWFFTGFLYRFAVITNVFFLAFKKQFRVAIFLYLFVSAILIISKWGFRGQPFIVVSLVAISAVITGEWWYGERSKVSNSRYDQIGPVLANSGCSNQRLNDKLSLIKQNLWKLAQSSFQTGNYCRKVMKIGGVTIRLLVGLMVIWLGFRVITHAFENRRMFLYETHFKDYEDISSQIKEEVLACGQSNVMLASYPGNTYFYWFTGMKPVSKYIFMWPWVAEVGLSDVLTNLSQEQILAIVFRHEAVVWGQSDKIYLRPLDEYLERNYGQITNQVYISPVLADRCLEKQK